MKFPKEYLALNRNKFANNNTSLIPIRYEDRDLIMKWRNEQMYHLRQKSPLSRQNQEEYFKNIVSKLYNQKQPSQLLFSYLENNELVGYGGLVHIDWESKKAEISFIMNTTLEEESFSFHWSNYLSLIEDAAFNEIGLKAIYTYAYDLRPHLYHTLEDNSFILKNRLKKEVLIDGEWKDVLIHEKTNPLSIRLAREEDSDSLYRWSNDPLTRSQSYNKESISIDTHINWFEKKIKSTESDIYILEYKNESCGVVRFEKEDNHSVIGISISAEFRGKRLATPILKMACEKHFQEKNSPIYAYIKKTNTASIKSFQKAQFILSKELMVYVSDSVLYIREA